MSRSKGSRRGQVVVVEEEDANDIETSLSWKLAHAPWFSSLYHVAADAIPLGEGAHAQVFRGQHRESGRMVVRN